MLKVLNIEKHVLKVPLIQIINMTCRSLKMSNAFWSLITSSTSFFRHITTVGTKFLFTKIYLNILRMQTSIWQPYSPIYFYSLHFTVWLQDSQWIILLWIPISGNLLKYPQLHPCLFHSIDLSAEFEFRI